MLVHGDYTDLIIAAIEDRFSNLESISFSLKVKKNKAMITIVGSNLSDQSGISGKIFKCLQNQNINIDAIQDDLSETRISFIVNSKDSNKSVQIVHEELLSSSDNS
ncbi:MAG: ACT domain-containing protein [Chlamydiae bacterium]|nr:ACT domain-containing protein [Chlamydiota bacterium]